MKPALVGLMALSVILLASGMNTEPSTPTGQSDATRIDITQHSVPSDAEDRVLGLAEKLAWPVTLGIVLFAFRTSIRKIVGQLGNKGGEISVGGLGIKIPVVQGTSIGDDVLFFKTADPTTITNDSAKTTLLRMLREPGNREYVVINLGNGNEWISSRLFIFALMLQRMKSIHSIVFLDGSVPKFLATASPDLVRWSIAQDQPWLEQAYLNAYAASIFYQPGDSFIVSKWGALDPQVADNLVRNFVQFVKIPAPGTVPPPGGVAPPESRPWAILGTSSEYGTWLSGADVQKIVGEKLSKDVIIASKERRVEAKALLQCTAPYVARIKNTGEFLSLIDRIAFIDEFTSRLVSRLEWIHAFSKPEDESHEH